MFIVVNRILSCVIISGRYIKRNIHVGFTVTNELDNCVLPDGRQLQAGRER